MEKKETKKNKTKPTQEKTKKTSSKLNVTKTSIDNKKKVTRDKKETKKKIEENKKEKQVKKEDKPKLNKKSIILYIIIGILSIILIYSLINIIIWFKDNNNTNKTIKKLQDQVEIKEVGDNENTEIIEPEDAETIDEFNPYWDYIGMNLIDVNIGELKSINSDVVGWIQVNGTNINYPFVQTTDNSFYLTHSFYKNNNTAGWVFLDYRNNINEINRNNIIYAHARLNNTMFGTLRNILETSWVNNPNNYVIKMSTEYENTLWQVFSIYRIPTTNDYLRINFNDNDSFLKFANMLKDRSEFNFNTEIGSEDRILTLSTCYDENSKTVLHAKLIKREGK